VEGEDSNRTKIGNLGYINPNDKTIVEYNIPMATMFKNNENPGLILYRYRWVVLIAYFLTSAATGSVQGSLSTNRKIIDRLEPTLNESDLAIAKYSDLVLYLPANFLSVWMIEKYGLRFCISFGSCVMLIGSCIRLLSLFSSLWVWFCGHIICMSSQAFLKNPVTKLASNWFGDKERGTATAIGIVSGPLGIFISKVLILSFFNE
jgi:sugar phosphate permease